MTRKKKSPQAATSAHPPARPSRRQRLRPFDLVADVQAPTDLPASAEALKRLQECALHRHP